MSDSAILDHLLARRDFCVALLELSREQRRLIADRNYAELLAVIGRKQRVLGRLDAWKQHNPHILTDWRMRRDGLAVALRQKCETAIHDTESLLAELLTEEQASTEELTLSRDDTARQLRELATGRQAHQAYDPVPAAHSRHSLDIQQ